MAGGLQYMKFSDFFAYLPTATSEQAGYDATRLADWSHTRPLVRTWRSTSTIQQTITCAFSGVKSGTWVALLNANFSQVQIAVSSDGTTFTDIVTGSGTLTTRTIAQDLTDGAGFYKLFLPQTYSGKTHGRIVIPAQTAKENAPYFSLGLLLWGNNITTMTHSFHAPLTEEYVDPEYRVDGKDWTESAPAGIAYKVTNLRNTAANVAEMAEWHAIRLLPPGTRLLWHYNRDDTSQIELRERNKPVVVTRHSVQQEIDTGLRSVA
jgi:hypothetical protein